ncbi:unnamed protein product, partial [Angiostrongylus costaricensis]|uniref:Sushi, von Willebrand factor type A, EGF and pentraxin domain containing 1 n=1 Tax=Angiostrongylus costaricensis TaxID=334426 RepID=A0A158PHD7_ANGCS
IIRYQYIASIFIHNSSPFKGCDVVLRQSWGTLVTPGSTRKPYPPATQCTYTIELPEGYVDQALSIQANLFDIAADDFVYEGSTMGRALHDGSGFNNDRQPPSQLVTRLGRALVVLQTSPFTQAMGFNLTFSLNCPVLKTPPLVSLSTKANTYGVVVSCPAGFEFASGRGRAFNLHCQLGGRWTENTLPNCQPVYCSAVPQIANGFAVSATNVSFGGVVKYSCYKGFEFPSGSPVEEVRCGMDGNWTNVPNCRAAVCSALLPFTNGERWLEFGDGTGYGTIFRFKCHPGYRREGPATLLCKTDGQWSFEQPKCVKVTCVSLPRIANGHLRHPRPFQFGDVARLHCDAGFRVNGPEEVRCCLANQSLSAVPSCHDVNECTEGLAQCQEASTQCVNLPGGYTCRCLSGFQPQLVCSSPSSLVISTVVKSVTFHFTAPKVIEKIAFYKVASGEVTSIRIRYSEEDGLPLRELLVDGKNVILVLPYSIESRILEITIASFKNELELLGCQKSSCADVNECMTDNGHCDHICINKQGSYKCGCREGYDLFTEDGQGGIHLKDDESGESSLDVIKYNRTCIPRSCPPVYSPENGKLLSTLKKFQYPVVVEFQCNFGYQMMGPDFIQCLSDGSWNGTAPFCLPATCQGLKNNSAVGLFVSPENSTIAYGHNVTIVCTQQNRPARAFPLASFRECVFDPRPDGREYWLSGPAIDCPFVNCGPPPALAGVVYEGDHEGSVLTFTCRPPYFIVGKSTAGDKSIRCGVDGSWDLGDLRCEGPVCVDPGFPDDGFIELDSVEEGAVARFSCNRKGYRPFPSPSIQCVLGAACVLSEDVGISSGFIPDGAFADNSDSTNWGYEPHKARLSSTGWCGSKDAFIFLSVDLQRIYTLTTLRLAGVAGSGYLRGHVTKMQLFYKTQFSQNYDTYPMEFETPPKNHNAMHQFELTPPLRGRYILLGVTEYEENPCIRFDLLGCLAPMTISHEIPSHLQVGWNASVPQCMDAEPPLFQNCPLDEVFTETDENGQINPVHYEEPKAEDNSGRIAYVKVEPVGFSSGRLITSDVDVIYTAFDDAGNTAQCVVKLRLPDTIPPVMKCPDSYELSAFEPKMNVIFNLTSVPMVIQDVSNITEVIFNPAEAVLEPGEFVEVEVTATDALANRNQCKFQVAYIYEKCSMESLSSAEHVLKNCTKKDSTVLCTITCEDGYRFVDEEKVEKSFTCVSGSWSPSGIAPACVPVGKEPARYDFNVAVNYPATSPAPEHCLKGYASLVAESFDSLDEVLSQRCSSSVQVFVRFLNAEFINGNGVIVGNYTIQILPTVLQSVFYDLCGLTLRTIFDLGIPGKYFSISRTSTSQGFSCADGEVLRQRSDQLSECLPCSPGSVNVNNTCVQCPLGSYQDERGQVACKACPEGTFTLYEGAHSEKSCLAMCANGMYSQTGLVPCQLCPRHTFSGTPIAGGFKKCTPCSSGTYTARLGSSGPSHCKKPCQPGTFSLSGLDPCSPCPLHHYQPALGQQRCLQCSNQTATTSGGQDAESACEAVDCAAKQCVNKAECVVRNHRAVCECRPGFVGERCELIEPVCASAPCYNGGSCEAIAGSFRCICPQNFTGARCQFGINECVGVSCPNGGVCHDLPGFGTTKCLCCRTGFAGPECAEIEDICSSANPCHNGADCIPLQLGRFKCKCLPGWEGPTCDINIANTACLVARTSFSSLFLSNDLVMGFIRLQPPVLKNWSHFCLALNSSSSLRSSLNFHSCNERFPRLECARQLVFLSFVCNSSFPTYGRTGSSHRRRQLNAFFSLRAFDRSRHHLCH